MKREYCPLCGHLMDQHCYTDKTGQQWQLLYCESCDADFAVTSNGLSMMLEPQDTRPMRPMEVDCEPD